ncbi:MAG: c-type cytochrome [Pseudanabaena sp. ELA607]
MKNILLTIITFLVILTTSFTYPAQSSDLVRGAKIFAANCASCHAGGKNLVQPHKTLKKDALDQYGMNSSEAIIAQVTKGKNAMPAFKGRLKPAQIEDVAAYVLDQANNNDWK